MTIGPGIAGAGGGGIAPPDGTTREGGYVMRTVTVAHNLFTFDELLECGDDKAIDRAKSAVAEIGGPEAYDLTEFLTDRLRDSMGPGCQVTEWEVGWSQSDGLVFTCDIDDLPGFTMGEGLVGFPDFPKDDPALAGVASVAVNGGDLRGWGRGPSVTIGWGEYDDSAMTYSQLSAQDQAAEAVVLDWYRQAASFLYEVARGEYEAWWETDQCAEYARDMGLEFHADGSRA